MGKAELTKRATGRTVRHLLPRLGSIESREGTRPLGCEPPQGDGVIRIRRNALSPWSREDHPECQASSLLERTKEEVVNTRQVAKVRGTLKGQ